MKLAIGSTMHWKDWVITDELTNEEIETLLLRAGGWVVIDVEKNVVFNHVNQRWEPLLKKEELVARIKDDLASLKNL